MTSKVSKKGSNTNIHNDIAFKECRTAAPIHVSDDVIRKLIEKHSGDQIAMNAAIANLWEGMSLLFYIHASTYVCIHTHINTQPCIYTYINGHIHIDIYTCIDTYTHAHIHAHINYDMYSLMQ